MVSISEWFRTRNGFESRNGFELVMVSNLGMVSNLEMVSNLGMVSILGMVSSLGILNRNFFTNGGPYAFGARSISLCASLATPTRNILRGFFMIMSCMM